MTDIPGVLFTPLKIIDSPNGQVLRAWRCSEEDAEDSVVEAYFSKINYQGTKGWKRHLKMSLNLVVCEGQITFVLFDDRCDQHLIRKISLGPKIDYARLTVPSKIWVSFRGDEESNMLINFANLIHEPTEAENLPLEDDRMPIVWNS